jgi:hypothetical protein
MPTLTLTNGKEIDLDLYSHCGDSELLLEDIQKEIGCELENAKDFIKEFKDVPKELRDLDSELFEWLNLGIGTRDAVWCYLDEIYTTGSIDVSEIVERYEGRMSPADFAENYYNDFLGESISDFVLSGHIDWKSVWIHELSHIYSDVKGYIFSQ